MQLRKENSELKTRFRGAQSARAASEKKAKRWEKKMKNAAVA